MICGNSSCIHSSFFKFYLFYFWYIYFCMFFKLICMTGMYYVQTEKENIYSPRPLDLEEAKNVR